jgi:hypothetical protein
MQPWLVDLSTPDMAILSLDTSRLLPATDPYGRQIVIGCGAFLELLTLAANAFGANLSITLWPDGEPAQYLDDRPFAAVAFSKAAPRSDPLFDQILARRTNREAYDLIRVPDSRTLAAVLETSLAETNLTGNYANKPDEVSKLRNIVWRGWEREMRTPDALAESVNVMRIGDRAVATHRDGLTLGGPAINLMGALGIITHEAMLDPASTANAQGTAMWKEKADTSPAFMWIASSDNSRSTQITSGRAYARMNLAATGHGLSIHPWSMALQEYPEMADLYTEQQSMLGGSADAPVQMLVRIGYAPQIAPAPRRGLAAHLKV